MLVSTDTVFTRNYAGVASSLEVTAYVRSLIDQRRKAGKAWRAIAVEFKCSHPHVISVFEGTAGVGPDLENAIAALLFKGKIDALRAEAHTYVTAHPDAIAEPSTGTVTVPLERYDDRELAVVVARRRGLDEEAIQWVESGSHDLPIGASYDEWMAAIERKQAELRRTRKALEQDTERAEKERGITQARVDDAKVKRRPKGPWRK